MTRITRLHAKNFRSIEALTLDLAESVTLLVGSNGAGKSNIIDAVSFIADALTLGLDAAIGRRDGIDAIRRRTPSPAKHGQPLDVSVEIETSQPQYGYGFTLGTHADAEWYIKEEWIARAGHLIFHRSEGIITSGPHDLAFDDQRLAAPLLPRLESGPITDALATFRRFDIAPDALRAPQPFSQARHLEPDGTNLNHIWSSLTADHPAIAERITLLLSQITPQIAAIRSQTIGRYKALEADFHLSDGDTVTVDGAGLSDGTLRALALLVAVYQPASLSLIAVEEPEKALHPHAAELLFNALLSASESPPLLISTHSPSILSSERFDLSMLRVVEWRDGCTIAGPVTEDLVKDIAARLTTAPDLLVEGNLTLDESPRSHRSLRPSR